MRHHILIIVLLSFLFPGCKKSSTPAPNLSNLGTNGLTLNQTATLFVGYWKTPDTINSVYYDANNNIMATIPTPVDAPYWQITTDVIFSITYYDIQTSNNRAISPLNAGTNYTTTLMISRGVTDIDDGSPLYPLFTINSISTTTLELSSSNTNSFQTTYTLNGTIYTAASVKQSFTCTKYTL